MLNEQIFQRQIPPAPRHAITPFKKTPIRHPNQNNKQKNQRHENGVGDRFFSDAM
jgi:hypothetical protein